MRTNSVLAFALAFALTLTGCGDSNNNDRQPAPEPPAPPPPPANTLGVDTTLTPAEVVGGGSPTGGGNASITVNLDDGAVSGLVDVSGITATAVTLNAGFAGEIGPVLATLESESASRWLFPDAAILTPTDIDALQAGGTYLLASSADNPDGAVRGQLLPGALEVLVTPLSGMQEVPPLNTPASGTGALTLDPATGDVVVHVNTAGLDDAVEAHIHDGVAGVAGPILIGLVQDPNDVSHWSLEDYQLDADGMAALDAGRLYLNVHTPANPPGEVRGQIEPAGVDVFFTALIPDEVVPPAAGAGSGVLAATLVGSDVLTLHANLVGLDDAASVSVHQAPVMQTGPAVLSLTQDLNAVDHWLLEDVTLAGAQRQALVNQGLYLTVATPALPEGAVRGQLVPELSTAGTGDTLLVTATEPPDGAMLAVLPAEVTATFNRSLLAASVDTGRIRVTASGGDGSFGDGNELSIGVVTAAVQGATLTAGLDTAAATDDTYQLALDGSSATPLTDEQGAVLDGDGDGNPGGDFAATFAVAATASAPTLTDLQAQIFTPSCAKSGCHAGAAPAQGMSLSADQTFANVVGVASTEVPSLNRIEPGNPDGSYLLRKVEGSAAVGGRMPLDGPPYLSNAQIQAIRDWISAGAEDN